MIINQQQLKINNFFWTVNAIFYNTAISRLKTVHITLLSKTIFVNFAHHLFIFYKFEKQILVDHT